MVDQYERMAVPFRVLLLNKEETAAIFRQRMGRASLNSMSSFAEMARNERR